MANFPVNPRDQVPLLLRSLMDRGPMLQPDNLVVTKTSTGYHTITLQEHMVRTKKLASALDRAGVRIGDRVGTLMWNSAYHLQAYHAISCMGSILHTANLRLGPKDLSYTIQHAQDTVFFVDHDLLELLAQVDASILNEIKLFVVVGEDYVPGKFTVPAAIPAARVQDYEAFLAAGDASFQWPDFPETTIHAICYTSGTTGVPKAAGYSHRSTYLHTIATAGADQLGVTGAMVVLPFVPMFHVLSWGVPFTGLMLGCRMVMTGRFMDPESTLQCMIDWEVELSTGVPTVWQGMKASVEKRGVEKMRSVLKLKTLTCGGSAPPSALMAWYGEALGVDFLQGWGMTETNPLGCLAKKVAKFKDLGKSNEALFGNIVKAGLPVPGVEFRIANADDLDKDMPQGEPGELLCRGPWIIGEYFMYDAPDKFHKGWLITGDVAKIDEEGAIVISDRSKDVIKSGGEWISSIDLENHITAMSEVAMAAVVAMPHPRWDERPVAIVALQPDAKPGATDGLLQRVHSHCLTAFAKFQLPDDVLVWEAIPLTSTGKLDKKVIRQRLKDEGYELPSTSGPSSKL
mmetsp:Transcript_36257/g.93490  ORF Transcript_36257/g.93490 Transcript_36257/m.93490 type:complete len:572 (+) Transcript_36257:53-1768(+)